MPTCDDSTQPTPAAPIDARQRLAPIITDLDALRERLDRVETSILPHRHDLRGLHSRIGELLADASIALENLRRREDDREPVEPERPAHPSPYVARLLAIDRRIGAWVDAIEPGDPTRDALRAGAATIRVDLLSDALASLERLYQLDSSEPLDAIMERLHRLDAERAGEILERGAIDANRRR